VSVAEVIAGWARELSDVGGRNTLLWAPDDPSGYLDLTTAHPGGVSMLLAGRHTRLSDLVREPGALEEARRTARAIHAKARELEDERGLVCGSVAIGVATWDPPRAGAVVAAPVLLRTCWLRPTDPGQGDFDLDIGTAIEVNPVLVNYLRSVAGVEVEPAALAAMSGTGSGFDPYPVYAALGRLCADVPGFAVVPKIVVGTYPHAKSAMVADLTGNVEWLSQVDLVAGLAGDGMATARLATMLPDVVDDADPEGELLVLDADPTQASVVEAVRSGRQLLVHAAPGAGSTQTVANLVAALAHDDRRVLLVTPSRHTVRDLCARLAEGGLGDLVLDLTQAPVDRAGVAAALSTELDRVMALDPTALADAAEPRGRIARAERIRALRRTLADNVEGLHEVRRSWGVSAYDVQQAMAELAARTPAPASRIRLSGKVLEDLNRTQLDALATELQEAARAGAWSDDPRGDPWYGAQITSAQEVARAADIVTRLGGEGLNAPAAELDAILAESSLPAAHTPADWANALRTMEGVRSTLEVFRPEIFDIPLDEHVVATGSKAFRERQSVQLGAWARSRVRRQTRRLLRPGRPPADLHGELLSAREQRRNWYALVGAGGRPEISPRLDEAQVAYDRVGGDLTWLGERLSATQEGGDLLSTPMPVLRTRLARLAARTDRLDVLPTVTAVLTRLRAVGMGEVMDDFAQRAVPAEQVPAELAHIWWASIALDITARDPRYGAHDGPALHEMAHELRSLDIEHRTTTAARVRAVVDRRARYRAAEHPRQAGLLRTQAAGERGQLPFADLFREAEDVLTALHPCLAASPYAVASLLAPGASFDVVVVMDASAVTTAEAVSALSRGRQAVLVGDPVGPTPSAFVVGLGLAPPTRPEAAATTAAPTEGVGARPSDSDAKPVPAPDPSVLDHAATLLPVRVLTRRHTAVDPRLAIGDPTPADAPPSPEPRAHVRIERVDGVGRVQAGTRAAIEVTDAEVDRVVQLVLEHAQAHPEQSLAVIALTEPLTERVRAQVLDAVLGLPEAVAAFFDERAPQPFVVVSLEQAHHVAHDVVILAVGYGRTPHGRVLHRFPSLHRPGAHRALARAASAAHRELVVVSALSAQDLDPTRLYAPAAALLRDVLARAEAASTQSDAAALSGDPGGDPVLAELAARLRQEGLLVTERFGSGPDRLDLAVGHRSVPGRLLVAVESDGPGYAALPGVRTRDRLRPEQVERMGWRHVRVWSTDVYRDPAREVSRIVAILRAAAKAAGGHLPRDSRVVAEPVSSATERSTVRVEQTKDDTDAGWGERRDDDHDRWLQEQRPPHWE
jgi:hypothetical protein